MTRRFLRITLVALIGLVTLVSVWPYFAAGIDLSISSPTQSASPQASSRVGACTQDQPGVTLVIDFSSLKSEPIEEFCVSQGVTGWQALVAAGLKPEGTSQYPTGFLCRLAGVPDKTTQPCDHTPTFAEGSWVYLNAAAETQGNWMYSPIGSATRIPKCGEFEGWAYVEPNQDPLKRVPAISAQPFTCDK